ncbi:MAG: hypothetical protein Q8O52_07045 [Sulfuritalea sp.]|nr:hypothetical protein [Sulfuritalea sp.]
METLLKRLLDAESEAEALVAAAEARSEELIRDAWATVSRLDADFAARQSALCEPLLQGAEARALQAIRELGDHHAGRQRELRRRAEQHEAAAASAVLARLLDPAEE